MSRPHPTTANNSKVRENRLIGALLGYNRNTSSCDVARMTSSLGLLEPVVDSQAEQHSTPIFLMRLEPRASGFFENVAAVFRASPAQANLPSDSTFWKDVFVNRRLPWQPFGESVLLHGLAIGMVWLLSVAWVRQHPLTPRTTNLTNVTVYSPEEYLKPLDTGKGSLQSSAGDPVYSRQEVISVPPEADNHTQTVVVPPDLKLAEEVPLPNVVSWPQANVPVPIDATMLASKLPGLPSSVVAPVPELAAESNRRTVDLAQNVVAPTPDIGAVMSTQAIHAPQTSVVAPPPSVDASRTRRVGDLNIAQSDVVAPAPSLPVEAQRASTRSLSGTVGAGEAGVVPPPPSAMGSEGAATAGSRMIALGIHPAALTGPITPPAGNRRGSFAATPSGRADATGKPAIAGQTANTSAGLGSGSAPGNGGSDGHNALQGVPPGLHVGDGPPQKGTSTIAGDGNGNAAGGESGMSASAAPPHTTATHPTKVASPLPDDKVTETERQVFGGRRVYSMTLNMPNLNSAGGSWIIRFSEMSDQSGPGPLTAPEATHKVDPGYPIELMRQNVQGTLTLRAVIHSDGHVSNVEILNSPDDRLDQFARSAFERWTFRPGTKNGNAVALQAVVNIPFKTRNSF
jgi:TonB family protein